MKQFGFLLFFSLLTLNLVHSQINANFNVVPWPAVNNADADWGDFNNDGRIDVIVAGALNDGSPVTRIYRNDGNNIFTFESKAQFKGASKPAVKWGDYNNDGLLDLIVCGVDSSSDYVSRIYRNNGDSTFTWLSDISLTGLANSSAAWADIDRDGDLDLFITGDALSIGRTFRIYENKGNDQFSEISGHKLPGVCYCDIDFTDLNKDGFPDIALAGFSTNNPVADIYINNGDNSFSALNAGLKQTHYASLEFGDYDRDGDMDLLQAGQADSVGLWLLTNDENTFTASAVCTYGLTRGDLNWGEYDNDGYPDILAGGMDKSYAFHGEAIRNNQDGSFTVLSDFINDFYFGSIDWVDYNYDGDMDAFVAGNNFGRMFINNITVKNTSPTVPVQLSATTGDSTITFSWSPASDDLTPSVAMSYNLVFGIIGDTGKIVCPPADFYSGFLKTVSHGNAGMDTSFTVKKPLSGNYIWSVQAVDNSFRASAFAPYQELLIDVNPPTVQTSSLSIECNSADSTRITILPGDGEQRIAFISEGYVTPVMPVDYIHFIPDSQFGAGSVIEGSGFYCVYAGSEDNFIISGLGADRPYTVFVLEFNGSAGMEKYLSAISGENSAELTTNLFNIITPQGISPLYRGRNNFADLDNDDDFDLLLYGMSLEHTEKAVVYLNQQGEFELKETDIPYSPGGDLRLLDVDGDNDVDIVLNGATDKLQVQVYLNDGSAGFSKMDDISIPSTYDGDLAVLDFNLDGYSDLVVTGLDTEGNPSTRVYKNNGTWNFTELTGSTLTPFGQSSLASFDVNMDAFPDLLVCGENEANIPLTELYLNSSEGYFTRVDDHGIENYLGGSAEWGDYDEDGDPDLLLTGFTLLDPTTRKTAIYVNDGTGHFTENLAFSELAISSGDARWADFNQDGLLDLVISGDRDWDDREAAVYLQNPDHSFTLAGHVSFLPLDECSITIADYDNDGDADIFISGLAAQNDPQCVLLENKTLELNLAPSVPSGLSMSQSKERVMLSWDASTDDHNSGSGLQYNLYLRPSDSTSYLVSPLSGTGDFQKINKYGTGSSLNYHLLDSLNFGQYTWAVQAIDAGGRYSSFSEPSVFTKRYTQTIIFDSIYPLDYGADAFTAAATSSLGLDIILSSSDEVVALIGSDLHVSPGLSGSSILTASQAGNDSILAADPVSRVLLVNSILPEIRTDSYDTEASGDISVFGTVLSHGGEPMVNRGICFGSNPGPGLTDKVLHCGNGEGSFQADLMDTTYEDFVYFRAFAENSAGVVYGEEYLVVRVGTRDLQFAKISLYPNPGKGILNIRSAEGSYPVQLRITDINQRLVLIRNNLSLSEDKVDVSALAPGIYIVTLEKDGVVIGRFKYLVGE